VAVACYLNTLPAQYAFDDHLAITGNDDCDPNKTGWSSMLTHDFWGQDITSTSSHKSYRPITIASFRLDTFFTSDYTLNARVAHATNIVLHAGCCVALLLLLRRGSLMLGTSRLANRRHTISTVAALLFAVHPVHTEAVAGVVGRAELLCFLLSVAAAMMYDSAVQQSKLWLVLPALLAVLLATICKETGIALIGVMWCCEVIWGLKEAKGNSHRMLLGLWAAIGYLAFRKWLTVHFTVGHEVFRRFENPIAFLPMGPRLLSKLYINTFYAGMVAAPVTMSADWSFNCIKMLEYGATDVRLLGPISLFTGLVALVYHCLRWIRVDPAASVLLGSAVWLVVSFAPSAGVLVDPGTTIAERLLYMPSAGLCLAVGFTWSRFHTKSALLATMTICVLLTAGSARTLQRNNDWHGEEELFTAAKAVCPDSVKVLLNTGILYRRTMEYDKSLKAFRRALKVAPDFCESDYWIGLTLLNQGKPPTDAIRELKKGVDCKYTKKNAVEALHTIFATMHSSHPNNTQVLIEWGELLEKVEMKDEASKRFELAGRAMIESAELQPQATQLFRRAKQNSPDRCESRFWDLLMSQRGGSSSKSDLELAEEYVSIAECGGETKMLALEASADPLTKLLQAKPNEFKYRMLQARVVELSGNAKVAAQQLTELGAMLYNGRRFRDAVSTLNKAVKADKSGCQTWVWLGHSQHQVGLVHEAVRSWKKVVKVSGKKAECQEAAQLARKMLSSFETENGKTLLEAVQH